LPGSVLVPSTVQHGCTRLQTAATKSGGSARSRRLCWSRGRGRNLAKVGVAGSNPVVRSITSQVSALLGPRPRRAGREWFCLVPCWSVHGRAARVDQRSLSHSSSLGRGRSGSCTRGARNVTPILLSRMSPLGRLRACAGGLPCQPSIMSVADWSRAPPLVASTLYRGIPQCCSALISHLGAGDTQTPSSPFRRLEVRLGVRAGRGCKGRPAPSATQGLHPRS
jgi:hypothetical protein